MHSLRQDLRYSTRMLLKHPVYSLIAVITLALGIGANAAIFSIINNVLLRSLPYEEPDRIVTLWENNTKESIARDDVSPANFLDWRERQQVFSEIAFANPNSLDEGNDRKRNDGKKVLARRQPYRSKFLRRLRDI